MEQQSQQDKPRVFSDILSEIVIALNKQTEVLRKNETDREKFITDTETQRDKIYKKQTQIHSRQLKIFLSASSIVILFLITSAVYFNILIQEMRKTQSGNIQESRYQEQVKMTIQTFKEMWEWYYHAIETDEDFRIFAKLSDTTKWADDIIIYYQVAPTSDKNIYVDAASRKNKKKYFSDRKMYFLKRIKDTEMIMTNQNINRFYNYFEILKSLDKAKMLDKSAAKNVLPFFAGIGKGSYYIGLKRERAHSKHIRDGKGGRCDCGSILDGYEYVFDKFLPDKIEPTKTHCLKED